eukprot:2651705-Pleurochrysis_carterae.AAC.1
MAASCWITAPSASSTELAPRSADTRWMPFSRWSASTCASGTPRERGDSVHSAVSRASARRRKRASASASLASGARAETDSASTSQ